MCFPAPIKLSHENHRNPTRKLGVVSVWSQFGQNTLVDDSLLENLLNLCYQQSPGKRNIQAKSFFYLGSAVYCDWSLTSVTDSIKLINNLFSYSFSDALGLL